MKTLIAFFLLLFSLSGFSQKNTVYFIFQPEDKGIGLRYDRQLTNNYPWEKNYGIYTSGSWGNYQLINGSIKDHVKFVMGIVRYTPNKITSRSTNIWSVGLTYHHYGAKDYQEDTINENIFFPLSVDLGTGIRFNHIVIGFDFDIIKWESVLNCGFVF